ncbi:MAG TPA: hypothetical protein VFO69_03920 [Allosphingosinicella sp.]|nr:hypothetical protein [Allosphingosinicella sp.]
MAKKSKSKAKLKLPKEVAGVKVPKGLRKQAKKLLEIIDSPAGRELAAAGLTLAAGSLAAKASDSKAKSAVKSLAREAVDKGRSGGGDAADLGAILSAAVAEGARRFLEGYEEGKQSAASAPAKSRPRRPPSRPSRPDPAD